MRRHHFRFTVVIVLGLSLVGCGGAPEKAVREKTVAASGVVLFQGKPLEHCLVTFFPNDQKRPAGGRTDASRRFTLGTNEPQDGAVPGMHKVTVVYAGPEKEVTPGEEPVEQEAPPPKVVLPAKYAKLESTDLSIEVPAGGSADLKIELK